MRNQSLSRLVAAVACRARVFNGLASARVVAGVAAFASAALLAPGQANAQWTQWGGPNRNFKVDSKGLAKTWPESGPPKIWSRDLGEGYSAILVDKGKLYTMYRSDGNETVICLNAKSGATVWEYGYKSDPREGHAKQFGEGPRATPLLSGDQLFTIGVAGKMHCLDRKTGKVRWTHDLWKEFDANFLPHGYCSSPIAYGDTVIVLVGGKGQSIVAFNKKDGSVAWKNLDFENSYSSPRIFNVDGKDQLITFMAHEAIGVDPNTGKLQWRYAIENQWKQNICTPVMADANHLFLSTSEAGARGLKLTRNGDKTKVEEIWSSRKIRFYHVTSIQEGDYVYGWTGGGGTGLVAAVNIKTGKIAWRKRGFAKATLIAADHRIIILDEDGKLALTSATPQDFTVHSQVELLDKVAWTVPTLVGKTLFVRDKKNIMALDLG